MIKFNFKICDPCDYIRNIHNNEDYRMEMTKLSILYHPNFGKNDAFTEKNCNNTRQNIKIA